MTKPTGKIWLLLTLLALAAPLGRAELVREELPDASDWVHDIVFEHEAGADDGTLSVRLGTDPVTVRYFEVPLSV